MFKNLSFIFLFTLFVSDLFCQNNLLNINGVIIDQETEIALLNVNIKINNTNKGTTTDENGYFEISTELEEATLSFSFIGYQTISISINKDSPLPLIIKLSPKQETLKEFTINSSGMETVLKDPAFNILDYSFYEDNILLIAFRNHLSKSVLIILNSKLDTIDHIAIPEKPLKLFKDCLGNNFIFCRENIYQIYFESKKLQLLYPKSTLEHEGLITSCIASDTTNLYFIKKYGQRKMKLEYSTFESNNHIVSYYYINRLTKERKNLVRIIDKRTSGLKARESAYILEKWSQLQKDGAISHQRASHGANNDRVFSEKHLFKEIYAPLHIINDTIYIFDYINSKIKSYSYGKLLKETKFSFHMNKKNRIEMIIDEIQNKIYAIFKHQSNYQLKEVDIKKGLLLGKAIEIPFPFPEKINVQDDYIYFLFKGSKYGDTKFLSRIRTY